MLARTIAQDITEHGLLRQDEPVVVGVSGGPDSMALLHLLLDLNRHLGWRLSVHVAHLNHRLRGEEAEQDAAFVQAAADSLEVPCTIEAQDIRAQAEERGTGVEETARIARYAFFERVCLQTGARRVAVGHNADDNAETILHRIVRGTGLRGLVGIRRERAIGPGSDIRVIRPVLGVSKKALRDYLADNGIAVREDSTNLAREPMRNRLRHAVLPMMEAEVNPQVRDALLRLAEQAEWLEEFLGETVQRSFESLLISRTDQELRLNVEAMARKSRIVQTELVRLAYQSFGLGEQDLGFVHLVAVLGIIGSESSGRRTQLPGGMIVEKRYGQLIFTLPSEAPRETIADEIVVHVPGTTVLPVRRLQVDAEILDVTPEQVRRLRTAATRFQEYVDFDAVRLPLVVRRRRPGERFTPLGAPGPKKVAEFLSDMKVDPRERDRAAILCDHLGPIWVVGHRIDDRVKMTELTKRVLHLTARPMDVDVE